MSTPPEPEFDLEQLFLPSWAKSTPDQNRYADFKGEPERPDRRRGFSDRPPRRRDQPPARGPGGARPPEQGDRSRRPPGREGQRPAEDRRWGPRREQRDRPAPPPEPLPEINAAIVPDDKGVESLSRQIKMTGRAYPVFEIAQMILAKPERHTVTFSVRKQPDGAVIQPLFLCALDETLWLSQDQAVQHLLQRHFTTFYQPERTQIEPPKGTYTFVAQCGMSGAILGPPNHHDYQNQLRKLHGERFARMPFEVFKSRIKIVRDEAVVKKWIDDQSWKTQYLCLNMPEPLTLGTRDEVERHFREMHLPNLVQSVETHRLSGTASRNLRDPELKRLVRHVWDEQRRFPIRVASTLSQQFASSGLQFFKINKTVTHVAVARPHYLDLETTPVSESIKRIVEFISAHPKCTHRQLLDGLAPVPETPEPAEPSPERTMVVADLHWLVHQGHVIEFGNGVLDTAKKPLPRPTKPAPVPAAPAAPAAPPAEASPPSESATAPVASVTDSAEPVTDQAAPTAPAESVTASAEPSSVPASAPSPIEPAEVSPELSATPPVKEPIEPSPAASPAPAKMAAEAPVTDNHAAPPPAPVEESSVATTELAAAPELSAEEAARQAAAPTESAPGGEHHEEASAPDSDLPPGKTTG